MVFNEKFVAVIVSRDGKILREFRENGRDEVKLPFGSEYMIRLKNLNSVRVAVSVTIDDEDVMDGSRVIVNPNETVDLEGFKKNGKVTHRFKFIEKTEEISSYRGDRIGDGIVRIEYQFEKSEKRRVLPYPDPVSPYIPSPVKPQPWKIDPVRPDLGDDFRYRFYCASRTTNAKDAFGTQNLSEISCNAPGITVKGSDSDQRFTSVSFGPAEQQKHVIAFKLMGYKENQEEVKIPVTTKAKIVCETCGKNSKTSNRFCPNCGTSLV